MAQRNTEYERLYNVGLLDDIHNYFPDLLYNSGQFSTVQDVLQYIRTNTRERFDLYSFGLREYHAQRVETPPSRQEQTQTPPPRQERAVETPPPRRRHVRTNATPRVVVTETISNARIPLHQNPSLIGAHYDTEGEEEDNELNQQLTEIVNFMAAGPARTPQTPLNLFSSLFGGLALPARTANSRFMEPVIVRPTSEEIERGSRVDTLAVASTDNCAICQDSFAAHSNRRTLTHCGHAFHMNCIDTWFQQNVHCPVCRHDIRDITVD